jgi:hypothetical protein
MPLDCKSGDVKNSSIFNLFFKLTWVGDAFGQRQDGRGKPHLTHHHVTLGSDRTCTAEGFGEDLGIEVGLGVQGIAGNKKP